MTDKNNPEQIVVETGKEIANYMTLRVHSYNTEDKVLNAMELENSDQIDYVIWMQEGHEADLSVFNPGDCIIVGANAIMESYPAQVVATMVEGIDEKDAELIDERLDEVTTCIAEPTDDYEYYVSPIDEYQEGETVIVGEIVEMDGESIASIEDLVENLAENEPGDIVRLSVLRGGDEISITVTLGETIE